MRTPLGNSFLSSNKIPQTQGSGVAVTLGWDSIGRHVHGWTGQSYLLAKIKKNASYPVLLIKIIA
jgi:hypothetical protein